MSLRVDKDNIYFVLPESSPEAVSFFLGVQPSDYKMMFIPKQLVFDIGWQKFKALQITNVIVMEEAHLMYPYIGKEWDRTKEDATTLVTSILRMSYLVGMPDEWTSERLSHLTGQGMEIKLVKEEPTPLWYITQYYKPDKAKRAREIKKCLEENVKCSCIDKVVLLNEKDFSDDFPTTGTDKIQQDIVGKRLTYAMVIEWIQANVPDNVICIFGNGIINFTPFSIKGLFFSIISSAKLIIGVALNNMILRFVEFSIIF